MSPFPDRGRSADQRLAEDLAAQAGRGLTDLRVSRIDRAELGALADAESHSVVMDRLRIARPDDVVYSEEDPDDDARLDADRVWFVDPLDGVREYAMEGRPDWAVHIALWERSVGDGGAITAAAIALPAYGRVVTPRGATTYLPQSFIRGERPRPLVPARGEPAERLRIAVSESAPPEWAGRLAEKLDAELAHLGSGGGKTATVVEGECDVFIQSGPHHQWDSAAAIGVAHGRGLFAGRLDGTALRYNQPDPEFPDLLVCRADLTDRIVEAAAEYL